MKLGRRDFLKTAAAGTGGLLFAEPLPPRDGAPRTWDPFEIVPLGKTRVKVSRVGFGTGMRGGNRQSNQTRLGKEVFERLLREAYERGVRFFDMADMYGTHPFVADALAKYPRDSYALQTKIWFRPGALPEKERPDADVCVERFLRELKTDYIDMVLIHCQTDRDWTDKMRRQMDILAKLKEKGLIRAHGASIHSFAALETAAAEPWVDTLNVRLNAYGVNMDDKDVHKVAGVVQKAHAAGKGIVAMKLIGEGKFRDDDEKRNESAKFVLNTKAADSLAVGFEKIEEVDDYVARVKKTPRT